MPHATSIPKIPSTQERLFSGFECGDSELRLLASISRIFLGAATGSPYIVFISTSGMLRSSDIYIYIYIIRVPTRNRNNKFIL